MAAPLPATEPVRIVYFSNFSENTKRFIDRLGLPALRIPVRKTETPVIVSDPYVLIVPTYGGSLEVTGKSGAAVPRQVVAFLNNAHNRSLCRGVIAAGNTNFGSDFGRSGDVIAGKLEVPYLYRFELMGTQEDVIRVREGLEEFWHGSTNRDPRRPDCGRGGRGAADGLPRAQRHAQPLRREREHPVRKGP